ncbi:hypothetical protein AIOL_000667 [Candidatus Rhodobacter oscarellae]|uniref:DUF1127 domain-containing protein n=1 Tax=Candidatus Rhodobacter oscarellae TaxID=1675527 RepID=A0A0J9ECV2_9RHOB|nr:hypothetical protein [Candidatus Rhodobacter lobularis]KMW60511.1 hypothetical protein AIOL_000667 [Candidatus Rhodobacter lobularis]
MADISTNAPWWAIRRFVPKLRILRLRLPLRYRPRPPLSDHLARDMGLKTYEIERLRLQLPSETNVHPRL